MDNICELRTGKLLTRHGFKTFLTQNESQKNLDYINSNIENKNCLQGMWKKNRKSTRTTTCDQ